MIQNKKTNNIKKVLLFSLFLIAIISFGFFIFTKNNDIITLTKTNMNLSSSAFENGGEIPSIYTCHGSGNHPPFTISNIPKGTMSLAMIVDDPDAPSGDFVHWVVWGISPEVREIDGHLPSGAVEGENSVSESGYFAPCPPSGTHHYRFTLYSLDKKLELSEDTNKLELEEAMVGNVIEQAELVGLVSANPLP